MNVKNKFGNTYSGTIGKEITCCMRKGYNYQRAWVKPYDPKSPVQLYRRSKFKEAMDAWRALPKEEKAKYNKRARGTKKYGVNIFVGEYISKFDF